MLLFAFSAFLALQVMLLGPCLFFMMNLFFGHYIKIRGKATGLILLPLPFFYARDLEFAFFINHNTDFFLFKCKHIFYRISILNLFIGRLKVTDCYLIEPEFLYQNKIPSFEKVKYMPPPGRVLVDKLNIRQGKIYLEDYTTFPHYKVLINDVFTRDMLIDLGMPFLLLFFCKEGSCHIGSGFVYSTYKKGEGKLIVKDITWSELINLDQLHIGLLKNRINLEASYKHEGRSTALSGTLGQLNSKSEPSILGVTNPGSLHFDLQLDWKELDVTFDMALRKAIMKMVTNISYGSIVNTTINTIAGGIVKLLKVINNNPNQE